MPKSWRFLRQQVIFRDRVCRRCGAHKHLTLHHIKPRDQGGSDQLENLVGLCSGCHDWVELYLPFEPGLRTRPGIEGSYPSLMAGSHYEYGKRTLPGYKQHGDGADIWTLWMQQGRKGAKALVKKHGGKRFKLAP